MKFNYLSLCRTLSKENVRLNSDTTECSIVAQHELKSTSKHKRVARKSTTINGEHNDDLFFT